MDKGNFVLFGGCADDREGVSAGGALQVLELVDGDFGPGGGAENRGVFKGGSTLLSEKAGRKGKEQGGGEDDAVH